MSWTAAITVTDILLIYLFKFCQNAFQAHVSLVPPTFKPQNSDMYEEYDPITTDKYLSQMRHKQSVS